MLGCGAHVRIIALSHVRCACRSACGKGFATVCAMCVRAARFGVCNVRSHFCSLFGTKQPNNAIIGSKKKNLERLFLFWNVISYFRMLFSILKGSFLF